MIDADGHLQALELFAPAADPSEREELVLNLGMLFDTSESMTRHLRLSRHSAVQFLESIPRAKDLILIFFDRDIRISRYNSENQQGIFERILETQRIQSENLQATQRTMLEAMEMMGKQAEVINDLMDQALAGNKLPSHRLRELMGHTWAEVVGGAVLGVGMYLWLGGFVAG